MKSSLTAPIENLFAAQTASWPLLARGVEGLAKALTRRVSVGGYSVYVRHIPHRIASTTAVVDPASIAKRPCFLCAANLPPEEKGLEVDSEFAAYCNPFPILDSHLTIVHREHRPQRIRGFTERLLSFAAALPGHFLIYNGPECGASAPDHLHFQACGRTLFPIEDDLKKAAGGVIPNYRRNVLAIRDADVSRVLRRLDFAIAVLSEIAPREPEPMLNLAAFFENGVWTALLFPRGKHRPAAFHRGEWTLSPATIDLCGVVVAPVLKDYERISGEEIGGIFDEVTLSGDAFRRFTAEFEKGLEAS